MEPSREQVNEFVQTVDEFMREYARLTSPETRRKVAMIDDKKLQDDYAGAVQKGAFLKATIEATTGAWSTAKQVYLRAIDQTSMSIGDAIDEIRSWFGYKPAGAMSGLGVVQALPAAAWITGILTSAYLLLRLFKNIMIRIDAAVIRRDDPSIPYDEAVERATTASESGPLSALMNLPVVLGGLAALYLLMR